MSKTENQKMFSDRRKELIDRQLSNSEAQDKAILTLSSSGLVLSITFIRFVIDTDTADHTWLLFLAWMFFAAAIVSTILSFLIGQKAINDSIEISYKYYIDDDDNYENKVPISSRVNDKVNLASSLSFVLAVILIALYIGLNLNDSREFGVTKDKDKKTFITDSANIPSMEKKSANIPKQSQKPKDDSGKDKK